MGGSSAGGGGGGSPNQQAKDKAAKDKSAANNRERARGGSQVSTGKSRSSSTASAPSGGDGGGNNNNNTINQVTKTAPTEAEVSQSTTTEADTEANRLLKIKKKGRSASIITSSKGLTGTSTNYSLGKKSLLGRV